MPSALQALEPISSARIACPKFWERLVRETTCRPSPSNFEAPCVSSAAGLRASSSLMRGLRVTFVLARSADAWARAQGQDATPIRAKSGGLTSRPRAIAEKLKGAGIEGGEEIHHHLLVVERRSYSEISHN